MDLIERTIETGKKARAHLWVPFLLPVLILVLIDYAVILAWVARLGAMTYILVQAIGLVGGFYIGCLRWLKIESHWTQILDYKLVTVIPTVTLGDKLAGWAFSSLKPETSEDATCHQPSSADSSSDSDSSSQLP